MVKILCTGDLHLGRKYSKRNVSVKTRLDEARLESLDNIVNIAAEQECDCTVITGDLFDTKTIDKKLIKEVCSRLSAINGQVVMIPGNHDYYTGEKDKLWTDFQTYMGSNTTLLLENEPYEFDERVKFYPCICTTRNKEENKLQWVRNAEKNADMINIGIAHGTLEGLSYDKEQKYCYMSRRELDGCGMDLWLLGHAHVPYPKQEKITGEHIFNAGTHQQLDISEKTDGAVFVIEISDDKKIEAKRIATNVIRSVGMSIEIEHGESLEKKIRRCIADLDPDRTLLKLTVEGTVTDSDYRGRYEIYDQLESEFIEFERVDGNLQPEITPDMIEANTMDGTIENRLLKQYLDDPKMLNLAYSLICGREKE